MDEQATAKVIATAVGQNPGMSALKLGIIAVCYYNDTQVNSLALLLGANLSMVSRCTIELEQTKYVERRHLVSDRRCVEVRLTDKGREVINRIK